MGLVRIGTRSSPLAMHQTGIVADWLRNAGVDVEIVPIATTGDVDMRPLSTIDERGLFVSQLEQALLAGHIDCAVHSLKDVRLEDSAGLTLVAYLEREDPRDAVCGPARHLDELRSGAVLATGSRRRGAALRALREDLCPREIRGNVQTRLRLAAERGDDGCVLAAAGLRRLGLEAQIGFLLAVDEVVPEAGQGCVVVQARADDVGVDWSALDHEATHWDVEVERIVSSALGGGCEVPLGVHVAGSRILLFAASPQGERVLRLESAIDRQAPPAATAGAFLAYARERGVDEIMLYASRQP